MNDYYISLAAVESLLRSRNYCLDTDADIEYVIESFREEIPPADVRLVKRGKWIPVTNGRGGHECDQCHNYAPSYQTGEERLSDFCPCCGADMMK